MRTLNSCPICDSKSVEHIENGNTTRNPKDPKVWSLFRCTQCDHGFLNPQPDWDDLAEYYNSNYDPYETDHGFRSEFNTIVKEAKLKGEYRHFQIKPGMRILDVGCGGGSYLRVAKELGADGWGVEPSEYGAKASQAQGLNVFHGTLEDYAGKAPKAGLFDLITFSHVVEHLPDPIKTLTIAKKLLANKGTIWIAVPNGACEFARKYGWRWHSSDFPLHLQHFSPNSLKLCGEKASLLANRIYTYSFRPALRQTILFHLRHSWKIPYRIASRLLPDSYVEKRAQQLDQKLGGEAILAEFV